MNLALLKTHANILDLKLSSEENGCFIVSDLEDNRISLISGDDNVKTLIYGLLNKASTRTAREPRLTFDLARSFFSSRPRSISLMWDTSGNYTLLDGSQNEESPTQIIISKKLTHLLLAVDLYQEYKIWYRGRRRPSLLTSRIPGRPRARTGSRRPTTSGHNSAIQDEFFNRDQDRR